MLVTSALLAHLIPHLNWILIIHLLSLVLARQVTTALKVQLIPRSALSVHITLLPT